jgi:phage-related minor tail protein
MTDEERERALRALEELKAEAAEAADSIGAAFDRAGESLAGALARAAADGEVSLSELARAVLGAVNAGAGQGLGAAIAGAVGGLFSGGRADGGPVGAGGAYLVGERGPEVFRPASAGTVESVGGSSVVVNVSVSGGPEALLRSEAQIAGMLARAAALGARRL